MERLQKFMASCGIGSRRKCEEIILSGRVQVNNNIITELGYKVDPTVDKVSLDKVVITIEENKIYIALNKPTGYLSTVKDDRGRKTLLDLVKVEERIYPIGRLDYDTSGLILLTNDGDIYNKVIHPRQDINKVYIATIDGIPTDEDIKRFCNGIDIGGYITAPAKFKIRKNMKESCEAEITIHEGKNRQIRKMCEAIKHPVINLKRVSIDKIGIGELKLGAWRYLTDVEVNYLKRLWY